MIPQRRINFSPRDTIDSISSIKQLTNGLFVLGHVSGAIRAWDSSGTERGCFLGHRDCVGALLSMGDGRLLSASHDGTMRLWDFATYRCDRIFAGHSAWICSAALTPRGPISGDAAGCIKLWDLETGECRRTLEGDAGEGTIRRGWIQALVPLPHHRFASTAMDQRVHIWDAETGGHLQVLVGHTRNVFGMVVLEEERLATGGQDGTVRIWNLETGACLQCLEGCRQGDVSLLRLLPNNRLAVCGYQKVELWDLATGCMVPLAERPIRGCSFLLEVSGNGLVGCGRDGLVRIWEPSQTTLLDTGSPCPLIYAACLEGGELLAVSADGVASVWDEGWTEAGRRDRVVSRCRQVKEELMVATWDPRRMGVEWRVLQELDA
jgi:WD40 repeat protein